MRNNRILFWLFPAFCLCWAIIGCDSESTSLAPVSGVVTYQGVPLTSGTIVFTPDPSRGTRGPIALGKIESNGKYTLYTKNDSGAVTGWHQITIVAVDESLANVQNPSTPRMLIPRKYQSPNTSGLVREVKVDQSNIIDFELD